MRGRHIARQAAALVVVELQAASAKLKREQKVNITNDNGQGGEMCNQDRALWVDNKNEWDRQTDRQADGRRILKRIQLLLLPSLCLALAAVASSCCLFHFFVFRFCSYLEFANELRLKTKSHAKQSERGNKAQSAKGAQRTRHSWAARQGEGQSGSSRCTMRPEKVYFILIFFARKLKWDLFITFSFCPLALSPHLAHSCQNYI